MYANCGCKEHFCRPSPGLVGKMLADFVEKVLVPRRGQRDAAWKQRSLNLSITRDLSGKGSNLGTADEDASSSTIRPV